MNEAQLGPSRKGQAGPCDITHTIMRFFLIGWHIPLRSLFGADLITSLVRLCAFNCIICSVKALLQHPGLRGLRLV